jgi:hypothetical protein
MRRLALLFVSIVAGCATPHAAREYLDNDTAATVTVAQRGWIFARERPDLAVHAQDYVTITPVQTNRNGQRTIYLYCHVWSTIGRLGHATAIPANAELTLIADDRPVTLTRHTATLRALGFGKEPVPTPNDAAELRAVKVDADLLRFLINAEQLRVAVKTGAEVEYFLPWRDGRDAAAAFLDHVAAQR